MKGRLAVVIPVRNGGELLHRSVLSCGQSALTGADAEILVFDNCSDDGAPGTLPAAAGCLPVRVFRNPRDLGRVGNWNRGVEAAAELGFEYVTFLFAGDTWTPGAGAQRLLQVMRESGADLGLAPYLIVDEEGRLRRYSARVSLDGDSKLVGAGEFLNAALQSGSLPITPLQANIYRLRPENLLRFDENRPLTTDMDATVEFLASAAGPVAVTTEPFCAWLARKGRVFCTAGLESFMADHFRQLEHAETVTGRRVNWTRAKSVFLLGYLHNALTFTGWRAAPTVLRSALAHAAQVPGTVNLFDMAALALRKFALGKSVVHLA
jgi:hypothetical protein